MVDEVTAENTNQAETDTTLVTAEATADAETNTEEATAEASAEKKDGEGDGKTEAPAFDPSKVELPEGFDSLDEGLMKEFSPLAEELGLNQEQAQKLISMHANTLKSVQEGQEKAFSEQMEQWAKDAKSDKELGGDKFDENLKVAQSAIAKFGTPELKDMLNSTGLGNHPEVIRLFNRVGKAISEDVPITGKPDTGQKKSVEERLYGKTT